MKLEVFFDYACPYCYVGHAMLRDMLERFPVYEVIWRPCEAHPHPEPRMKITGDTLPYWWRQLEPGAAREGLLLKPPFSPVPHSEAAIRGMLAVQEGDGDLWEYHDAVYEAMFVQGKNLEEESVILRCMEQAGVHADALADTARLRAEVQRLNRYAWGERRLHAVPSYALGDRVLRSGDGAPVTRRQLMEFLQH